jgi:hypothetical protein
MASNPKTAIIACVSHFVSLFGNFAETLRDRKFKRSLCADPLTNVAAHVIGDQLKPTPWF